MSNFDRNVLTKVAAKSLILGYNNLKQKKEKNNFLHGLKKVNHHQWVRNIWYSSVCFLRIL